MQVINIAKIEQGVIRVFAISRPVADMARALEHQTIQSIAASLLDHAVTAEDFELFALSDLTGVGLPRYLSDGYDVDKEAIRADHAKLDALDGYVLLVFSRVSDGGDVVLRPHSDLTLIGTYTEPRPKHGAVPIAAEAAKLYSGAAPVPGAPRRSRMGSALTGIATLLALVLIWWILR